MFAVLACSSVVVIERQNALRQAEVDSIFARSSAIVAQQSSYCDVCAVVIPSDTYKGKNLGSFIDSADCVVRFNAHRPGELLRRPRAGGLPQRRGYWHQGRHPRHERQLGDDRQAQRRPLLRPRGPAGRACRRGIVTWLDEGMEEEIVLFPRTPARRGGGGSQRLLDLPDAHELIRGFAYNQTREAPAWASSAFIALQLAQRSKDVLENVVFGLTTDDDPKANTGYADDPDKYISPAHDYVLEHDYYKMAVEDDWPGWDNVKYVQMEHPIGSAK